MLNYVATRQTTRQLRPPSGGGGGMPSGATYTFYFVPTSGGVSTSGGGTTITSSLTSSVRNGVNCSPGDFDENDQSGAGYYAVGVALLGLAQRSTIND